MVSTSSSHISIRTGAPTHRSTSISSNNPPPHTRQVFGPTLREQGMKQARCRHVEACIAVVFSVPHQAIRCTTRGKADVARARQVAMYLCHTSLAFSLTEVGQIFDRDRTTVGHACRLVEDLRDVGDFDVLLGCLEKAVEAGCVDGLKSTIDRASLISQTMEMCAHG